MTRDVWTHHILAVLAVVTVMAAFGTLMFVKVPPENRDAINLLLGAFITVGFASVYQFYFGSSQGSAQNREALAQSVSANATLAETAKTAGQALAVSTPPSTPPDGKINLAPGEKLEVQADPAAAPDDGELPADLRVKL